MPRAEARSYQPTYRERLNALMAPDSRGTGVRNMLARGMFGEGPNALGLADFIPGVGAAFAIQEGRRQWQRPELGDKAAGLSNAVLSVVPLPIARGARVAAKAGGRAAERAAVRPQVTAELIDRTVNHLTADGRLALAGIDRSGLSDSTYLRLKRTDGGSFHLPKSARREYFQRFPKANGGADDRFIVRVSDHRNVSGRMAPHGQIMANKPDLDLSTVAEQLDFILSKSEVAEPGSISGGHLSVLNRPEPLLGSADAMGAQGADVVKPQFDDKTIEILRRYGIVPGMIGGGAATNALMHDDQP